jgi:hypothetical protein
LFRRQDGREVSAQGFINNIARVRRVLRRPRVPVRGRSADGDVVDPLDAKEFGMPILPVGWNGEERFPPVVVKDILSWISRSALFMSGRIELPAVSAERFMRAGA